MSNILSANALELNNITKTYRIYPSPMYRLKEIIFRKKLHTDFTVLNNIDLAIKKGETFGIIGENGAGKSTLLKIIADTVKPTAGEIKRNGRISALLELGAGFNPELTGEENIFLNAFLLGLTKAEIESKKQDIIDFSELGEFIKRPVKTYSSGMYLRLAFSIAMSVNPEILIIDEALAVGDQHFQKKCIDRMMQFRKSGKTILFCSHALYLVQELCDKTLWLQNGGAARIGDTPKVINAYNDWVREKEAGMKVSTKVSEGVNENGNQKIVWLEWIKVVDEEENEQKVIRTGQDVWLSICVRIKDYSLKYKGHIGIAINRNDEEAIYGTTTKMDGLMPISFYDGQKIVLKFPSLPLLAGQYYFLVALIDEHAVHLYDVQRSRMFSVENMCGELAIVRLEHEWKINTPEEVA